jgi:hypothetical protein
MRVARREEVPLGVECALPALDAAAGSGLARLWRWLARRRAV